MLLLSILSSLQSSRVRCVCDERTKWGKLEDVDPAAAASTTHVPRTSPTTNHPRSFKLFSPKPISTQDTGNVKSTSRASILFSALRFLRHVTNAACPASTVTKIDVTAPKLQRKSTPRAQRPQLTIQSTSFLSMEILDSHKTHKDGNC
jgi:hypothetical protein